MRDNATCDTVVGEALSHVVVFEDRLGLHGGKSDEDKRLNTILARESKDEHIVR